MKNTKNANTKENAVNETVETVNATVAQATELAQTATKNAFDFLFEAQNKLVDTLMDNSKKLADSFKATEAIEKSRTYINEWLEKQQGTIETTVESVKAQAKFDAAPELLKVAIEAQQALGKAWFEALRTTLKANDVKELQTILTANVEKLQENVKNLATSWMENFGKPVNFTEIFSTEYAKEVTSKIVEMGKPVVK